MSKKSKFIDVEEHDVLDAIKTGVTESLGDIWEYTVSDAIRSGVKAAMDLPKCQFCGHGDTRATLVPYESRGAGILWNHTKCRTLHEAADEDGKSRMCREARQRMAS